jgi:hypothetical protein
VHDADRVHDLSRVHGASSGAPRGDLLEARSGSGPAAPAVSPHRPRGLRRLPVTVVLLVVLAAVIAVAVLRAVGPAGVSSRPPGADRVSAWLAPNLPVQARVAAPGSWRAPLHQARRGVTVVGYARARPGDVLILSPGETRGLPSTKLQRLMTRSELLAAFPGIQVRQVLDRPRAQALLARRDAGSRLVANLDVRLTPSAWRSLVAGDVDVRLVDLLAGATAAGHTIDVSGFVRDMQSRAAGAPARIVQLTAVDGQLVDDTGGTAGLSTLQDLLLEQPAGAGTVAVRSSPPPAVLLVTFPLAGRP